MPLEREGFEVGVIAGTCGGIDFGHGVVAKATVVVTLVARAA